MGLQSKGSVLTWECHSLPLFPCLCETIFRVNSPIQQVLAWRSMAGGHLAPFGQENMCYSFAHGKQTASETTKTTKNDNINTDRISQGKFRQCTAWNSQALETTQLFQGNTSWKLLLWCQKAEDTGLELSYLLIYLYWFWSQLHHGFSDVSFTLCTGAHRDRFASSCPVSRERCSDIVRGLSGRLKWISHEAEKHFWLTRSKPNANFDHLVP